MWRKQYLLVFLWLLLISPPHCVLSLLVCKPSLTYFCWRNYFPQNIRKFFKASELPRSSFEVGRNLVKSMLDINSFIRPFILEWPVLDKSSNEDTDLQMRPMSWWIAKSDLSGEPSWDKKHFNFSIHPFSFHVSSNSTILTARSS